MSNPAAAITAAYLEFNGGYEEIIYHPSWRSDVWDSDVPSRPGWQVRCSLHGLLGEPAGWAYASRGVAGSVATRHAARHVGEVNP